MEANIIKIGNSRGIIIPAEILKKMSLSEGNTVSLTMDGDTLVIRGNNVSQSLLKTRFYVCPVCGNIIHSASEAAISCHGINLQPLEPRVIGKKSSGPGGETAISGDVRMDQDSAEAPVTLEKVEDEAFITINHEMTKKSYIKFIAAVSADRVQLMQLFPEGPAQARFNPSGVRYVYIYSTTKGLFRLSLGPLR